eukprot:TRINITY_DN9488_c0_g2_i3.p1 TRINITY_DN9488_c0_g2~~TRINITY_DN9488_c0_g2_i3.p1  ORF type:complete len:161 (-),score=47.21 TRINITY_DN9488_c0_g2_i3:129-611(-)
MKGSKYAAGYDLSSIEELTVPGRGKALVRTGVAFAIPRGSYGRIAPRSGLAVKHSIQTGAGVIDSDYRGELHVLLFNHSDKDFKVNEGDRVAQLVIEKLTPVEIEVKEDLEETERGDRGFGSSGANTQILIDRTQNAPNMRLLLQEDNGVKFKKLDAIDN